MSILEDAVKHFSSKGERTIEVKEWNAVFTVKPLNLDEQRRLFDKTQKNPIEAIVDLIIMKCLKENGEKAFSLNDRQKLMTEVDPNILAELSSKITGETTIELEKKNLKLDVNLFNYYQLAELLHKTVDEVMSMSVKEYNGWLAYFKIKEEKQTLKHGK